VCKQACVRAQCVGACMSVCVCVYALSPKFQVERFVHARQHTYKTPLVSRRHTYTHKNTPVRLQDVIDARRNSQLLPFTYARKCTHTHTHTHTHTQTACTHTCLHTHTLMHAPTHCARTHACLHTHTCLHTHIHIHAHKQIMRTSPSI